MKKILITLTSSESKRLIAKYVSQMPMVKKTMAEGILNLQLSTTNGFIYEELSGTEIERSSHVCGFLSAAGGCGAYLPAGNKREFYFEKGIEKHLNFPQDNFDVFFQRLGEKDIIIKSGNLLDRNGQACVFVGEPSGDGGEWGKAYEYVVKNHIQLIVPMTLNKSANITIEEILPLVKVNEIDWDRTHIIADIMPLPGIVVTEIDAIEGLCNVQAIPVAMNGVGDGEGTVSLCIFGQERNVENAWELITAIKGEPALKINVRCGECLAVRNQGICVAQKRVFTRR